MQSANGPRYHAIDSLRATMISIVMFGHALLPYLTVPRSFKDPQTHIAFDVAARVREQPGRLTSTYKMDADVERSTWGVGWVERSGLMIVQ